MRILILQFSGTGNTYYVANLMKKAFTSHENEVVCYPIEKLTDVNELISQYDVFGIGFPIYGSDMPSIVKNLVETIHQNEGKRAFTFCTQMMYSGDGAAYLAKKLIKKGFIVRQCEHFNMPNNLRDYAKFLPTKVNYQKLEKRIGKKVNKFCLAIENNQRRRKGMNILSNFLGWIQRYPYQKMTKDRLIEVLIDKSCILCKKCVSLCPVTNFSIENGKLVDNKKCILCYRCINHCPVNALHINPKNNVDKPYHGPTANFKIDDVMKSI